MYVNVVWKNSLPGRRGDSEVIECDRAIPSDDRLNCYEGGDEHPFISVALDQVMLWEVVKSPEDVKPPEPDFTQRVMVAPNAADILAGGGFTTGYEGDVAWVDIPIYRTRR